MVMSKREYERKRKALWKAWKANILDEQAYWKGRKTLDARYSKDIKEA